MLTQLRRESVSGRRTALRGRIRPLAGQLRELAWCPASSRAVLIVDGALPTDSRHSRVNISAITW